MMRRLTAAAVVWWTLAALALVGQALDIATTAISSGGVEANPLGAFLMAHGGWPLLIGAKLALACALGVVLIAFAQTPDARRQPVALVALVAAAALVFASYLIAGNNVAVWLITAHLLPWQ